MTAIAETRTVPEVTRRCGVEGCADEAAWIARCFNRECTQVAQRATCDFHKGIIDQLFRDVWRTCEACGHAGRGSWDAFRWERVC